MLALYIEARAFYRREQVVGKDGWGFEEDIIAEGDRLLAVHRIPTHTKTLEAMKLDFRLALKSAGMNIGGG
jgi:hypothetical protein